MCVFISITKQVVTQEVQVEIFQQYPLSHGSKAAEVTSRSSFSTSSLFFAVGQ